MINNRGGTLSRTAKSLALAGMAAAALLTSTAIEASGAGTAAGSPTGCHWTPGELVGGQWQNLYFCADVVGYIGGSQPSTHVYLDRADYGPHPGSWAGHIGEQVGSDSTQHGIQPGDHWWRVCRHDDSVSPYYCTGWYHQ